jgi:hypothetical protein
LQSSNATLTLAVSVLASEKEKIRADKTDLAAQLSQARNVQSCLEIERSALVDERLRLESANAVLTDSAQQHAGQLSDMQVCYLVLRACARVARTTDQSTGSLLSLSLSISLSLSLSLSLSICMCVLISC